MVPKVGTFALFLHQGAVGELLRLASRAQAEQKVAQISYPTVTAGKVSIGSQEDLFLHGRDTEVPWAPRGPQMVEGSAHTWPRGRCCPWHGVVATPRAGMEGTWRSYPRVGLGVLSPEHGGIRQAGVSGAPAHERTPAATVGESLLLPSLANKAALHFPPLVCGIISAPRIRLPWQRSPQFPSGAIPGEGSRHVTPAHWEQVPCGPHATGWLPVRPTASTVSKLQSQHPATNQAAGRCLSPACLGQSPHEPPISCPPPNPRGSDVPLLPPAPRKALAKGTQLPSHLLPQGWQPEQLAAANHPLQLGC